MQAESFSDLRIAVWSLCLAIRFTRAGCGRFVIRAATGKTCCALHEPSWFCDRAWCQLVKTFVPNTLCVMLPVCTVGLFFSFCGHFLLGTRLVPSELAAYRATSVDVTHTDRHPQYSILALSWPLAPFCLSVAWV